MFRLQVFLAMFLFFGKSSLDVLIKRVLIKKKIALYRPEKILNVPDVKHHENYSEDIDNLNPSLSIRYCPRDEVPSDRSYRQCQLLSISSLNSRSPLTLFYHCRLGHS